jgi:hypothetical protein
MGGAGNVDLNAVVARVVQRLGTQIIYSPQRVRAAINDELGEAARSERGMVDALVLACEERVPVDAGTPDFDLEFAISRLTEVGLSRGAATFAVQAWRQALPPAAIAGGSDPTVIPETAGRGPLAPSPQTELPIQLDPRPPGPARRLVLAGALVAVVVLALAAVVVIAVVGSDDPTEASDATPTSTTARASTTATTTRASTTTTTINPNTLLLTAADLTTATGESPWEAREGVPVDSSLCPEAQQLVKRSEVPGASGGFAAGVIPIVAQYVWSAPLATTTRDLDAAFLSCVGRSWTRDVNGETVTYTMTGGHTPAAGSQVAAFEVLASSPRIPDPTPADYLLIRTGDAYQVVQIVTMGGGAAPAENAAVRAAIPAIVAAATAKAK